jgi:hypothetical protein
VLFTLYLKEDVNEDGSLKLAALAATAKASGGKGKGEPINQSETENGEHFDEGKALDEARRKLSGVNLDGTEDANDDDVD